VAGAASIGGGMAAVESSPSRADSPSAAQSTELGGPGGGGSPALLAGTDTERNRAQTRRAEKRERDAKKRERKAERKRSATNGAGPNAQERAEKREKKAKVQRARGRENALTRGRGYKRGLRRKTGGDTPLGQRAPNPKPTSDEGDGDTAVDQEPTDAVGDLTPTDRRTKPLDE